MVKTRTVPPGMVLVAIVAILGPGTGAARGSAIKDLWSDLNPLKAIERMFKEPRRGVPAGARSTGPELALKAPRLAGLRLSRARLDARAGLAEASTEGATLRAAARRALRTVPVSELPKPLAARVAARQSLAASRTALGPAPVPIPEPAPIGVLLVGATAGLVLRSWRRSGSLTRTVPRATMA